MGITSILLKAGPCDKYIHEEDIKHLTCDASLGTGVIGGLFDIIAYPLTCVGKCAYMNQWHLRGMKGLLIASWIIICILLGINMAAVGITDDLPVGLIVGTLFWSILGWSFLLVLQNINMILVNYR